ncbi:MAG: hypothetical protein QOK49_1028, partial [Baekduia sp.]|nr:hypothetical protein [Baekduia sp.]
MSPPTDPDLRIAALAAGQHGPVAHRQLRALGLTQDHIAYRLRVGRLIAHHPEVYLVGHRLLTREGRWMAAVLACGRRAVLSHADAAAHWGLIAARDGRIHATTPSRSGRVPDRARITLHRVGTLRDAERTTHDAIPVTTPARTLLDLASRLRARALEDAIAQMVRLDLFDLVAVRRCLAAHPRQHGAPALKRLLERLAGRDPADLRSATELALAQLCDDHDLPEPATNVQIEGFTVDFHWPGTTLVVEGDGYTYHNMPTVFESDRDRDQRLILAGYTVARFTYTQLTRESEECARRLRGLLTRC